MVKAPFGVTAGRVRRLGERKVCTSIIVAAELRYGAAKRGSPQLADQLAAVLGSLEIMPFKPPADRIYGEIRTTLERAGRPITGNDVLIAAHALALGAVVVTDNESEFARIDGLRCENWLRRR